MAKENPILLYDGVCNLCNNAIDFILKRDRNNQFHFVVLQSESGKELFAKFEISPKIDSVILILEEKVYIESDAAIEIARLLPTPWNWFLVFYIIPVKLRNRMYKWIAGNRYRWFGKRETCRVI